MNYLCLIHRCGAYLKIFYASFFLLLAFNTHAINITASCTRNSTSVNTVLFEPAALLYLYLEPAKVTAKVISPEDSYVNVSSIDNTVQTERFGIGITTAVSLSGATLTLLSASTVNNFSPFIYSAYGLGANEITPELWQVAGGGDIDRVTVYNRTPESMTITLDYNTKYEYSSHSFSLEYIITSTAGVGKTESPPRVPVSTTSTYSCIYNAATPVLDAPQSIEFGDVTIGENPEVIIDLKLISGSGKFPKGTSLSISTTSVNTPDKVLLGSAVVNFYAMLSGAWVPVSTGLMLSGSEDVIKIKAAMMSSTASTGQYIQPVNIITSFP